MEITESYSTQTEILTKGKEVIFGRWQYTITQKKKSPLRWIVMDISENDVTLISKYLIGGGCFYIPSHIFRSTDSDTKYNYEISYLRHFLNDDFLGRAFNAHEKSIIIPSENGYMNDLVNTLTAKEAEYFFRQ